MGDKFGERFTPVMKVYKAGWRGRHYFVRDFKKHVQGSLWVLEKALPLNAVAYPKIWAVFCSKSI